MLSLSEAIANELKGTSVTVTVLYPGATEIGFIAAADLNESGLFKGNALATSREVAQFGYKKMMTGKIIVIHGFTNNILAQSVRFALRNIITAVTRLKLK